MADSRISIPPLTVLVVDDDEPARLLTVRQLETAGADVRIADDGVEALYMMRTHRPDVALLDHVMPRLDGLNVCRAIRGDAELAGTHVIMISACHGSKEVLEAFAAGVDDFLAKPCDPGELQARLHVAVRQTWMRRRLIEQVKPAAESNERLTSLNAQLRFITTVDELTGVLNRRGIVEHLEGYHETAVRHGVPMSLAMIDLDGFKLFNDNEGHPAGDEVLRQFAALLGERFRSSDIVGRMGGDEFLVILPHTTADFALLAAERCRASFEADPLSRRPGGAKLTMSVGVLEVPACSASISQLLIDVGSAAYAAKRRGKTAFRSRRTPSRRNTPLNTRRRAAYHCGTPPRARVLREAQASLAQELPHVEASDQRLPYRSEIHGPHAQQRVRAGR